MNFKKLKIVFVKAKLQQLYDFDEVLKPNMNHDTTVSYRRWRKRECHASTRTLSDKW